MKLEIFTLVLDGEPYIRHHLPQFEKLLTPWHWTITHGVAANTGSTAWCRRIEPRWSLDATTPYLHEISTHPNVTVLQKKWWPGGKDEMVRSCTDRIKGPCLLLEIDSDECWTAEQLERMTQMFEEHPHAMRALFWCKYYLGKNIIATSENGYGNRVSEWARAWKFTPGMQWQSHEPPMLNGNHGAVLSRDFTRSLDLVFQHFAYADERSVTFKENYYNYPGALAHWRRLQENQQWPISDLRNFLPWVGPGASADIVK